MAKKTIQLKNRYTKEISVMENKETDLLNLENYKQDSKELKKLKSRACNFILNNLPREDLIEFLKKKHIIERDWNNDKEKYREIK